MSGAITPRERGIWANLINRYDICKNGSLDGRADIAIKLRNSRDKNMAGIPIMGKEGVSALGGRSAGKGGLALLWQAAICFSGRKQRDPPPIRTDQIDKKIGAVFRKFQKRTLRGRRGVQGIRLSGRPAGIT